MREDLARIVSSLISNIGRAQVATGARFSESDNLEVMNTVGYATAEGLEVLSKEWPGLTTTESYEVEAVVKSLRKIYSSKENN